MRISRSAFVDPVQNGVYAASAVAISVLIYAYSTRFGPLSILFYYAIWLPLLVLDYRRVLGRPSDIVLPGIFVSLLLASTLWSAAPAFTLRGSCQFATHVACALVAARVVNLRSLTRGVLIGTTITILYSLTFGYSAYDAMDGSYTFVGAFGSKNQLGLFCSLGILFAILSALVMRERFAVRASSLLLVVFFALVLEASRSATSVISLSVCVVVLIALLAVLHLGPLLRAAVFFVALPFAVTMILSGLQFGAGEIILGLFGKDSTLTGRTYLWGEGMKAFGQAPFFGLGYMAYWVQGFPEAERLWEEFYIASRTGFHFHNTFIETLVELGAVGTLLLAYLFLSPLWRLTGRVVFHRSSEAACLLALLVLLFVRSLSEIDTLYPYTVGAFLLFYLHFASRRRPALEQGTFSNVDPIVARTILSSATLRSK